MPDLVPVTFEPSGLVAWVEPGITVLGAAKSCGITIAAPCGGRGVCGSCGVRVVSGELQEPDAYEAAGLRRASPGIRLACRARIKAAVTLRPLVASVSAAAVPVRGEGEMVAAVDLGTTTVAAAVVEVAGGGRRGSAVVANRQQAWGSDVVARISAAMEGAADELREAAVGSVMEALELAANGQLSRLSRVLVAGNTAMVSLLAGVGVESLATHPFTAPGVPESLSELSMMRRMPSAEVLVAPPIAAFVGGDTLAGLVYTGMLRADSPQLLVDLGTNAEIALVHRGLLYVASAAAGPAFEGVGIEHGGPATAGAITDVSLDSEGSVRLQVVGDEAPGWFAGSGLVSAIALLRRSGHLDADGLLRASGPLAAHFLKGGDGVLRVRFGDGEGGDGPTLSQLDVRAVQLAKAAVRVGIRYVLQAAEANAGDLEAIYVAGAFGGALRPEDLVSLGVIPDVGTEIINYVGNASLEGALEMALNMKVAEEAVTRTRSAVHVELATDAEFGAALMDALALEPSGI